MMKTLTDANGPCVSIGIIAWNEEDAIGPALESLFKQTLFAELHQRELSCEIVCLANGCTDNTSLIATWIFEEQIRSHPHRQAFRYQSLDIKERGKINAWNVFVHQRSARSAEYLILIDGDIVLREPETLWNLCQALEQTPHAHASVDRPVKDISLKPNPSAAERLSLAISNLNRGSAAKLSGQLYCIRSKIARNIYLPRDLAACEDGFVKHLVCTHFLTEPHDADRIIVAPNASHIYEAYRSPGDILRNQKRQMIGQAFVHLLIDRHLRELSTAQKLTLADTLRERDKTDPDWLKKLMARHLRDARFFWRLFPDALAFRFQRLASVPGLRKLLYLPATLAGFAVNSFACATAFLFLRRGATQYWPDTRSARLAQSPSVSSPPRIVKTVLAKE